MTGHDKSRYIQTGYNLLKEIYDKGILNLNPKYQQATDNYPITVLNKNIAADKNTADLFTRKKALAYWNQKLNTETGLDKAFLLTLSATGCSLI